MSTTLADNRVLRGQRALVTGAALTYRNGVYGEIGFRNGISAIAFAMAAEETDGKVYSIDIDSCETGLANVKEVGLDHRHTFIQGDSTDGSTVFPEKLDVLYIDGNHNYESVKADYELHAKMVKPGGIIFFHDPIIHMDGVGKFLIENQIYFIPIGVGLGIRWVPFEQGQTSVRPSLTDRPAIMRMKVDA